MSKVWGLEGSSLKLPFSGELGNAPGSKQTLWFTSHNWAQWEVISHCAQHLLLQKLLPSWENMRNRKACSYWQLELSLAVIHLLVSWANRATYNFRDMWLWIIVKVRCTTWSLSWLYYLSLLKKFKICLV